MAALAPAAGTYWLYELWRMMGQPTRQIMRTYSPLFFKHPLLSNEIGAVFETLGQARLTHDHPDFNIDQVQCGQKTVAVTEKIILKNTFCNLLHFRKNVKQAGPKVLIIAPMSGHYATLVRGTIQQLLISHDVYVTDWKNARDIPLLAGKFDLDSYVEYLMTYLRKLGGDTNIVAICQATVPALAAVSLLAQDDEEDLTATLTMLAGPNDPRVNQTQVNKFATAHTMEWFKSSTLNHVPWPLLGTGRQVYPGFRQVGGFMSMNMSQHLDKHTEHFKALVRDDLEEDTSPHRSFYDEYCAVMDLTAEFYLDTVERIFQLFQLPQGQFRWRGRLVEPHAISRTAVLAIEGGQDDITGVGQTKAAFALLTGLSSEQQSYHLEKDAGHYGVFNGRLFRQNIAPEISRFISTHK